MSISYSLYWQPNHKQIACFGCRITCFCHCQNVIMSIIFSVIRCSIVRNVLIKVKCSFAMISTMKMWKSCNNYWYNHFDNFYEKRITLFKTSQNDYRGKWFHNLYRGCKWKIMTKKNYSVCLSIMNMLSIKFISRLIWAAVNWSWLFTLNDITFRH